MANEYLKIFFLITSFYILIQGTARFVEDDCIWKEQSKLIDCNKKSFQSLQFRTSHPGYTTLSIQDTPLKQLDFNISYLPDLEMIDARRTKLNCRRINLRILELVEHIIVDQRMCLNSICCRKLQTLSNYNRDINDSYEETMSSPAALMSQNDSEEFESEEPLNIDVTSGIQSNNNTKSAYNIIRQEIQVNSAKSKSARNTISISTEIKINYDKALPVHQPGPGTGILVPIEMDLTIVYSILGLLVLITLVSVSFSLYVLCSRKKQRNCSIRDFMPTSSLASRSRSQGTVIL